MSTDPSVPAFWSTRYERRRTPWDFGGVPAALQAWLDRGEAAGRDVLIPGCGSGCEIAAFASAGARVTAIDFSPAAVQLAREHVGPASTASIVLDDFFTCPLAAAAFDVVYERTFLCALPPARWPEIAARVAHALKPGGRLVGYFFFGPKDDGPPFGLSPAEAHALLGPAFDLEVDEPVRDSLPLFAGGERWQLHRRK